MNNMSNKIAISLDECKRIQLEMLVEIDTFCRARNIKYMLAYGTLLGAIRHKGYIPWDDDVDISMPYEDMLRFKKEFKSDKLEYIDVDTDDYFFYAFSRVVHKPTYSQCGAISRSHGICIDLYPVIKVDKLCETNLSRIQKLIRLCNLRDYVTKWRSRAIRYLPIKNLPFVQLIAKYYKKQLLDIQNRDGNNFYFISSPISVYEKDVFDMDPFSELIDVEFENLKFMAPANYDRFLRKVYGDYMQLPPEDQRHPYHSGTYFWK